MTRKHFDAPSIVEDPAYLGDIDPEQVHLAYDLERCPGKQRINAGRLLATPQINLNDYRCRAVVDWVEIGFSSATNHQPRNLAVHFSKELGRSGIYVTDAHRGAGRLGNHFIARVQEPTPGVIQHLVRLIEGRCTPNPEVAFNLHVAGIEVSVDFFVKKAKHMTRNAVNFRRWQMVETIKRHLFVGPGLFEEKKDQLRWVGPSGAAKPVLGPATERFKRLRSNPGHQPQTSSLKKVVDLIQYEQAPLDATLYAGRKDNIIFLRIMDKITDKRDPAQGTHSVLEGEDTRARLEVALLRNEDEVGGPAAIGLNAPDDLFDFAFHDLRAWSFTFFLPTMDNKDVANEVEVFRRAGVMGLEEYQRAKRMLAKQPIGMGRVVTPLGDKGHRLAYVDLNQKVQKALRSLSEQWGWKSSL